jgi:hypothetical protein
MAVSAPFAVEVSIVRGARAVSLYAAFSRKPIFPIVTRGTLQPPLDYRPLPDFLAPSAERASSSILMRDSAAANACSATESAGITT